ncbi:MAG: ABC transporter permease subunit [Ignavibacteria bacterium]|nr:ABC transporter permease subunit [Ignavibacteria bacterium]
MVLYSFIRGIFKEALAKKILLTIFGFFTLIIVLIVFAITNSTVEGLQMMLESKSEGGLREAVMMLQSGIVSGVPMFMLVASMLIITSSFVPDMLKKGHIDLILSKPISRTKIILGHFIAGVVLVFVSFLFLLGIIWIIVSLKTGYWNFYFLYSVLWFTLIFAVLYSAVILIGLLSRSSILTIIINLLVFFPISWLLYLANRYFESDQKGIVFGAFAEAVLKFLYQILPKAWNMQDMCDAFITQNPIVSYQPLISSLLFMAVMLSVSIWYFNKKDY